MSSNDLKILFESPGKIVVILAIIAFGGGSVNFLWHPNRGLSAELRDCKAVVNDHADTIVSLREKMGDIADIRRLPAFDGTSGRNPFAEHKE